MTRINNKMCCAKGKQTERNNGLLPTNTASMFGAPGRRTVENKILDMKTRGIT